MNIYKKVVLFFCTFIIVSFSFASIKNQIDVSLFPGQWKNITESYETFYDIKANGTFTGKLLNSGQLIMASEGKWEITGNTIKWEHRKSLPKELEGEIDYDTIVDLSTSSLEISDDEGKIRKYRRQ